MSKNKMIIPDQRHLTLSDRTFIEQELVRRSSFKSIAIVLRKDPTTISKEVKKHRKSVSGRMIGGHCRSCKNWVTCTVTKEDPVVKNCPHSRRCCGSCRSCWTEHPQDFCLLYTPLTCKPKSKVPYVCNGCMEEKSCRVDHYIYQAVYAQKAYEYTLVRSQFAGEHFTTIWIKECSLRGI